METHSSVANFRPDGRYRVREEREHRVSKRGRVGEGRPTKRLPEVVAKIASLQPLLSDTLPPIT
jgi:hypothetical protein